MNKDFSFYLSKFLGDYLIIERNLSQNTIKSYKKTFQILINYLVKVKKMPLNKITFSNITRDIIVDFLNYLEEDKKNSVRTRNQRLACIKSFYQFCLIDEIENVENIRKVLSIKSKKFTETVQQFLTEEELLTIFNSIDLTTQKGLRDLTLLSLLYDTGARASEIVNLKISEIHLEDKYIILTGKGNKQRIVSIMENTRDLLKLYIKKNNIKSSLLPQNSTYELIRYLFKKVNNIIKDKNITPHTFRRTRATHLLDNGVNIIYIQHLLGHSNINTTEKYAKVINKTKFKAIEDATPDSIKNQEFEDWNDDRDLLNQLLSL